MLLDLVAAGCKAKATGFGRAKLDVPATLEASAKANPNALVFGTDIPSARADRPFAPADIDLVEKVLGADLAGKAFWANPVALYRIKAGGVSEDDGLSRRVSARPASPAPSKK